MIDYAKLTSHQQAFVRAALETVPDDVSSFAIDATKIDGQLTVRVKSATPFALSDDAVTAVNDIFTLHETAGQALTGIRSELVEDDGAWDMSMEFDYAT